MLDQSSLPQSLIDFGRSGAAGSSEFGSIGADAQAELVQALVRSSVQLNSRAVREAMFLQLYLGPEGAQLVQEVIKLRYHATPGVMRRLIDALKSLSLFEFMKGIQLNLGGK